MKLYEVIRVFQEKKGSLWTFPTGSLMVESHHYRGDRDSIPSWVVPKT